jgi:exodeoxyribonuclease VII small subunit
MSFEADLRRLEEIVRELESGEHTLDRALELFEEGVAKLRDATAAVARAEASVKVLRGRADALLEDLELDA